MATDDESPVQSNLNSTANSPNGSSESLHETNNLAPSRPSKRTWSNPEEFPISRIEERSKSAENLSNEDGSTISRDGSYRDSLKNSNSSVCNKHPLETSHDNEENQVVESSPNSEKILQRQSRVSSKTEITSSSSQLLEEEQQNNFDDVFPVEEDQHIEKEVVQDKVRHGTIERSNESINVSGNSKESWTELKEITKVSDQSDDVDLPEIHFPLPVEEVNV